MASKLHIWVTIREYRRGHDERKYRDRRCDLCGETFTQMLDPRDESPHAWQTTIAPKSRFCPMLERK